MYNKKISKLSLYLIITVFIVSATANQSFALIMDEFSPEPMQMAAGLMNSLFNKLAQDQDIQEMFNMRDVDRLNEMSISLFKLQSYIAGFHNKVRQNTLNKGIVDFAAEQIHESAKKIKRIFSEFCRGNSERYLKERYSYEIEKIDENLSNTTKITRTNFMGDIKQASRRRQPFTEQGVLLGSLEKELSSLDMALFMLISTLDQRN